MKIHNIVFTGADDTAYIPEMEKIQLLCPYVEWGILFSESSAGKPRYPLGTVIEEMTKAKLQLSAHLCGYIAKNIIQNKDVTFLDRLNPAFKRIQINYNFHASTYDLEFLKDWLSKNPERAVILQKNFGNLNTIGMLGYASPIPKNLHILNDASGGNGKFIEEIHPPKKGDPYIGYAGGITPQNVKLVEKIITGIEDDTAVFIDMESGVRDENNRFSIEKVWEVLGHIYEF